MTTPGPSIDEADESLVHDVACVLLNYTRDRPGGGLIGRRLVEAEAQQLAAELASDLGPRIGGRYVPMRDMRQKRNEEVVAMFNGRNRDDVMRHFKISRRVFYRVLTEHRNRIRSEGLGWRK